MPSVLVACPHCGFAKNVPKDRIPKSDVQVTCPQCRHGFPLRMGTQPADPAAPPQPARSAPPTVKQQSPAIAATTIASTPRPVAAAAPPPGSLPPNKPDCQVPSVESWYVGTQFRHLLIVVIVLTGLASLTAILQAALPRKLSQIELLQHLVVIASFVASGWFYRWRVRTPLYELSAARLLVIMTPFASGRTESRWGEILGLTIQETGLFGVRETRLQLLLGGMGGPLRQLLLKPKMVDRPEALLASLQERVPPLSAKTLIAHGLLGKAGSDDVRYGDYVASRAGIAAGRNLIPWEAVREITTPPLNLAGYGSLTIVHADGSKLSRLTVTAKMAPAYPAFVRALLGFAPQAAIDAGVAKILDCPPRDALIETGAIFLLLVSLVVELVAIFLTINYEPVVALKAPFSLLTMAAGMIPFTVALQLFLGQRAPAVRKLSWVGAACAGPVGALLVLFLLFPSGWHALRGDLAVRSGDLVQAEAHFIQALASTPDNLDARFALGLVYRDRKEYARAYDCLQRVYQVDSNNWAAFGMELIPDTLLKMEKYDEAIAWCNRIILDHHRNRSVVVAMDNKKSEIIRTKRRAR